MITRGDYLDNIEKHEKNFDILSTSFLTTRTVLIFGEINQELARKVCTQLLLLSNSSPDPITIILNSQGGHVESGDTIHDMIKFIPNKVNIIGSGWVASAGVTIYLSVEKDMRFSLPNTRYMIHQPLGGVLGQATDIEIEAKEITRIQERINRLISNATGQSYEKVAKDTDRNYWMSNEEAIDYGLVGKVVEKMDQVLK